MSDASKLLIRQLGLQDYDPVWRAMQTFTQSRNDSTTDEIWLLQHSPVYTLGLNGKRKHLLIENEIPVMNIDRGGQITYHGPGQLVIYTLIKLDRKKISVRDLVQKMEQAIIDLLAEFSIEAARKNNAPGVYVNGEKIAALGLRIKKNCSYHGLSLNIDMDLAPFTAINPCGYEGMPVTQLHDLLQTIPDINQVSDRLLKQLCHHLLYTDLQYDTELPPPDRG